MRALLVAGFLFWVSVAVADAATQAPAARVPGATIAVDPSGSATLQNADETLSFVPAESFQDPGLASAMHPLIVWIRFPAEARWRQGAWYLESAPGVGFATLFYEPPGAREYAASVFGMRVPFERRSLARVIPTLRLPPVATGAPLYVRVSLDDETRLVPILTLIDAAALRHENELLAGLSSIALVFIGIFISLAVANLLVFSFVRESTYLYYSCWMLVTTLFAATYVHNMAWQWLWPSLSLPEEPVMAAILLTGGIFLIAFARSFLRSRQLIPRVDRVVTWICAVLIAVGVVTGLIAPSAYFGGGLIGRDVFLLGVVAFVTCTLVLGIAGVIKGDKSARFFVVANVVTGLTAAVVAVTNLFRHGFEGNEAFVAFMTGSSAEGWILFGALAFRLRETVNEVTEEQKRRLVAQAEALVQARDALAQRQAAATDALTGVANRRAFDEALVHEWDRCARARSPMSLIMLDIDYFKQYNDAYGHVSGDECLRSVASAMVRCATRPGDLCCRYGGEEFAVILGETNEEGARRVAADILHEVSGLGIPHRGSPEGRVTVSAGVATALPEPGSAPSIVEVADASLYRAKQSGRNRFVTSEGGEIHTAF